MARIKQSVKFQKELNGLLLMLIAVIGFGRYGIVGRAIDSLAIFLIGYFHQIFLIILFFLGLYLLLKSKFPKLMSLKWLGVFLVAASVVVLFQLSYINEFNINFNNILDNNVTFMQNSFNLKQGESLSVSGSGVIGSIKAFALIKLFDQGGTKIIMWVILAIGTLLLTGLSVFDIIKKAILSFKWNIKLKTNKKEIMAKEVEYEKDTRVVVSSIDELIQHTPDAKEEHKEQLSLENFNVKGYSCPPLSLLRNAPLSGNKESNVVIKENVATLERVFKDFEIEGKVVAINVGPSVTQYEMDIKAGTKVNRVLGIHKEIALALAAKDIRIQAPIPGKKTIGVEIPNKTNSIVTVREILESVPRNMNDSKLLFTLGKSIMGKPIYAEINKTPHLLVSGATGSGKSVCINSMIISILMRARPDEVKLVLIDPKKVELSVYNGIPHLLTPVVTDPRKANVALKKIVSEMERRYDLFSDVDAKNIAGYNLYVEKKNKFLPESEQLRKLPFIVVIIDELADLMLVAAKDVEDSIMRITQMARASGIHLVVATQRPSTDVITGLIKSNIPSRISFAVSSSIDSRTILDMSGAEKLLGKGDMLFLPMGENAPMRIQGAFITDEEIKAVVDFTISQQKARYDETMIIEEDLTSKSLTSSDNYDEPLYNEIVEFVIEQRKASASLLQRKFRLGYNRAARVVDLLEERGIVGPNNGSKPREVLVKLEEKD